MQAGTFSTRAWDAALKAATELGLAQQTEDAASRLQQRKASLVLALQNMSNSGFQNVGQASGKSPPTQHACTCQHGLPRWIIALPISLRELILLLA